MDMEQFKMLIDLAREAGEGATWLVIMMIVKSYLSLFIAPLCMGIAAFVVIKIVKAVERVNSLNGDIYSMTGQRMDYHSQKKQFLLWVGNNWK